MKSTRAQYLRTSDGYKRARKRFLERNPLCVNCLGVGRNEPAAELDHVVAIRLGGSFWNRKNWQGLCTECHVAKTRFENSRYPPGSEEAECLRKSVIAGQSTLKTSRQGE